jgi:hypothetical protein
MKAILHIGTTMLSGSSGSSSSPALALVKRQDVDNDGYDEWFWYTKVCSFVT